MGKGLGSTASVMQASEPLDMKNWISLVLAISVGVILASCAYFQPASEPDDTTHQTNRQTYELPYGRTYN